MELVILTIKNGFLFVVGDETVFCKDLVELHKEIEFLLGDQRVIEPDKKPKASGVRQFDDED